jgi:hypothetical protein
MIEQRERLRFVGEPRGKSRFMAHVRRQDFERDQAVELFLPRLIHRAHAALADEFEDFQLRKQRCEFGDGGRDKAGAAGTGPVSVPMSTPEPMPALSRHSGHNPSGALAASALPQRVQMGFVSMRVLLLIHYGNPDQGYRSRERISPGSRPGTGGAVPGPRPPGSPPCARSPPSASRDTAGAGGERPPSPRLRTCPA